MKTFIDLAYLQTHFPDGDVMSLQQGELVSDVHKKIEYIHWLIDGTLSFVMSLGTDSPEIEVCSFSESLFPIGWYSLDTPIRYTKRIAVASEKATFYRVKINNEKSFLNSLTDIRLHKHVAQVQFQLLKAAVCKQKEILPKHVFIEPNQPKQYEELFDVEVENVNSLLRQSPFFDSFDDAMLEKLAPLFSKRDYQIDDIVFKQDELSEGISVLIAGNIRIQRFGEAQTLAQWPIKHKGFILGWAGFIGEKEICTAKTVQNTSVYFLEYAQLNLLLANDPEFAIDWYTRINWLIDNHINAAFVLYLSIYFNFDELTIRYLIENYQTQIKVSSDLHKIPHLLGHRSTKGLAIHILKKLVKNGTARERRIASIGLDLLKKTIQENDFMQQLQRIYETVTDQPKDTNSKEIRLLCAKETQKLARCFSYKIVGQQNLPDEAGNIFIYNHLVNDRYYTLNNNFQITLESHFISAMLLAPKYGDPGFRVVRIGRNKEYAHQNYYERMGYINVFTRESETTTKEDRAFSRNHFFEEATAHLKNGDNIIISPEGTSYHTEDDIPGPFKSGAFRLALEAEMEPWIVPIITLNFDKRINDALKYCEVLQPFKVSEHPLFTDKAHLDDFVQKYHDAFKAELEKAKALILHKY